jgi:imidazolonepropionase-like amidohydrolase
MARGALRLALAALAAPVALGALAEPTAAQLQLGRLKAEAEVAAILGRLKADAGTGAILFRNVHVVDPDAGTSAEAQQVLVGNGKVLWIGALAETPRARGRVRTIDGEGGYLAPGLIDMHVHVGSAAGWLLQLANGVTTVRDMAGFPWMLRARDALATGRMLGPSLKVAGPLFNEVPLEGYAVVPDSSQEAARMVRQQAACGYDFVKLHNVVSLPMFDAIAAQSRTLGMDLVGHVPHGIPVRHAVEGGMRTLEHLKGFLDDRTLKAGDTDFAAARAGATWIVPTLYANRGHARGDELRRLEAAAEMRYAPAFKRARWHASHAGEESPDEKLAREARPIMASIVASLVAAGARIVAGTDSDGYDYHVSGFAVVEEVQLLHAAGLPGDWAVAAAPREAAAALREPDERGRIRKGMRADLVLLAADPLRDPSALRSNRGVMARGRWLDRGSLDGALAQLAPIMERLDGEEPVTRPAAEAVTAALEKQAGTGFVFSATLLVDFAQTARAQGWTDLAQRLDALAAIPSEGPCADQRRR